MSQENVEIVRRSAEAFSRGDWEGALAEYDEDVEWLEMPSLGPDAAAYMGRQQIREAIESWLQMWREYDIQVSRYADAGDEVVLLAQEHGSGGASGVNVERELGEVFTIRDGKVVRVRLYGSWNEALEAAGLSE